MNSKRTKIVTLIAILFGVTVSALVWMYPPPQYLRAGGIGFLIVMSSLAFLRTKKAPSEVPLVPPTR